MDKKIVFGRWEGVSLLILAMCTQIFVNMPRSVAEAAGTAGWLLTVYVSLIAFILLLVITRMYSRFEGMDLLDISEYAIGNIGRIIVGSIIYLYLMFIISVVLREYSENVKIIDLTESPISFVTMFYAVGMIVGAYAGIEAIARLAAIGVPVITVGYVIIAVSVSQHSDFSRIMPILGLGPNKIFVEGLSKVSIFSGLLALFLIAPFLKTRDSFKRVGYIGLGLSAVFLTLSALVYLLVYPYPTALENFLPMYQLARLVSYGRFFQRIESLFMIVWVTAALLYLSFALFLAVYLFSKTFKLKYYRPLIIPFAIITYTLSLLPPNLVTAISLETSVFRNLAWMVTYGLTILLLVIANMVKKEAKKGRKRDAK